MDEKQILAGNKLIAEFMGYTIVNNDVLIPLEKDSWFYETYAFTQNRGTMYFGIPFYRVAVEDISYHKSWDWLMPAVDKIVNIELKISPRIHRMYFNTFRCRKSNSTECIYKIRLHSDFKDVEFKDESNCEIDSTYKVILQFINWYKKESV